MQPWFKYSAIALAVMTVAACGSQIKQTASLDPSLGSSFQDLNGNGKKDIYEDTSAPVNARVHDIISRLSLEQKVSLVTGTGFKVDTIGGSTKVPGAAGSTFAIPQLGIPAMVLADGPAGLRIEPVRQADESRYYATAFPIATALASTWDTQLVEQVGNAMGEEVKDYGVDLFLAPGMNLQYNPLGGRNFEYYSEDPLLSGNLAAAIVNGVESHGVGATIKHFVANSAETSRMWLDAHMNERALREMYLRGFEIAVKQAQPWAIMTSYNKVNGVYTPQDEKLLTEVLRNEWGFEGLVMTDWFAGDDPVAQMIAGNDLIMPGMPDQRATIKKAVENGTLDEVILDRNLSRILTVMLKSPSFNHYEYSDKPDLTAHAQIARQAAAEGVVLLKNTQNALPLKDAQRVAAFGNSSYDFLSGGTGSGDVNEAYTVSLVEGIEKSHLVVSEQLKTEYSAYLESEKAKRPPKKNFFDLLPQLPEYSPSDKTIAEQAEQAQVAIITIGRNSGEFYDRKVENDFDLNAQELSLIERVSTAFHGKNKNVVVILNIGNVIETVSWRDMVDAIVLPWQGGQEAGNAIVDVLSGRVNPSGKLATTFPIVYKDISSAANFPGFATSEEEVKDPYIGLFVGKKSQLDYTDGIYVGYRYYDTFNVDTAYEFGFGLSYTTFTYSEPKIVEGEKPGDYKVSATITNTGNIPGKEVVQLYLSAPSEHLDKPVKELKGFSKTQLLNGGEHAQVEFTLIASDLASFDPKQAAWVAEAGHYQVKIASSSNAINLQGSFDLEEGILVSKTKTTFTSPTTINEIKPH
ncbi:glycoside hydrolase family 3 C-terminal domain-containing protein [Aliiglaciecola sp. LCG003]|uniref:glycoside hydrolase family 3 C-terminal domain-containing protein n=1 Tax=Aliiglaciecola sp. LCG003 TaxID=3053655 RepID=UPI0025732CEE|nr:glycoside hydrolase family 3 C-terminal domain-containing protein [Aliiglaciecola sp. LCG003]WJG09686.1 glycoside hydrolase family 3 C-terminal domain-containing protein [Aliiglaciecola sp. LCG003]